MVVAMAADRCRGDNSSEWIIGHPHEPTVLHRRGDLWVIPFEQHDFHPWINQTTAGINENLAFEPFHVDFLERRQVRANWEHLVKRHHGNLFGGASIALLCDLIHRIQVCGETDRPARCASRRTARIH